MFFQFIFFGFFSAVVVVVDAAADVVIVVSKMFLFKVFHLYYGCLIFCFDNLRLFCSSFDLLGGCLIAF